MKEFGGNGEPLAQYYEANGQQVVARKMFGLHGRKEQGYEDNLIHLLKTQEIARTSQTRMKRILNSDLVIIDDLMFMAMEKSESNLFFQFINKLYGQASIILTSNKCFPGDPLCI
jgi:hypothetical protein